MPFFRPMIGPRFGRPGLLGTVARTAVIAGTATATSRAISRAGDRRAAEQQAYAEQQREATPPPPPPHDAPPSSESDLVGRLTELARLKESGALTQAEYENAKGQLLR